MGVSNEAKPQPDLKAVWVRKRHIPFLRPALVVTVRFDSKMALVTIRQGTVRADSGFLTDEEFKAVSSWAHNNIASESIFEPLRHQISHEHERRVKVQMQRDSARRDSAVWEQEQFFERLRKAVYL